MTTPRTSSSGPRGPADHQLADQGPAAQDLEDQQITSSQTRTTSSRPRGPALYDPLYQWPTPTATTDHGHTPGSTHRHFPPSRRLQPPGPTDCAAHRHSARIRRESRPASHRPTTSSSGPRGPAHGRQLRASDLSGRARSFQSMVGGGMPVDQAVSVAGLMVED